MSTGGGLAGECRAGVAESAIDAQASVCAMVEKVRGVPRADEMRYRTLGAVMMPAKGRGRREALGCLKAGGRWRVGFDARDIAGTAADFSWPPVSRHLAGEPRFASEASVIFAREIGWATTRGARLVELAINLGRVDLSANWLGGDACPDIDISHFFK